MGARTKLRPNRPSRNRRLGLFAIGLFAAGSLLAVAAACAVSASEDVPDIERRAQMLNENIMCPVCPGESIDQSQNPLSAQMRAVVKDMLAEGKSEAEIQDFFVARYGPSVLLEPPAEGFGLAAWIVPPAALLLAIAALLLALRRMRTAGNTAGTPHAPPPPKDQYLKRIEKALDYDSDKGGR